uniref:Uncharacterized protein n=1 Tax=Amorphochlora amoebiformis TaxID=1561963 RepID=A0A7S0DEX2_9EUKA
MANYPPPDTGLQRACVSLTKSKDTPWEALREFLKGYSVKSKNLLPDANCYNLSSQIPAGPNGTISGGDWSGVGTGQSGQSWDFETCTFLIEHIGTNNVTDMFPPRNFTLEWLNDHCASRFGPDLGVPRPGELANLWGFDRLLEVGASNIIFTNGLKDGWSVGGIQSNLSDTLIAINIKDGAHHSDLSHTISGPNTTDAVKLARVKVTRILKEWLDSIPRY